jgi:hypothetical protein
MRIPSVHQTKPHTATYQRGSKKIDFVLLSPRLVEAAVGVSILALYDGYFSITEP